MSYDSLEETLLDGFPCWQDMPDGKKKKSAYYASREWAALRDAVKDRADGVCERCGQNEIDYVHHIHYDSLYHEQISDLRGVCEGCHHFIHNRSDHDPKTELHEATHKEKQIINTNLSVYVSCDEKPADPENSEIAAFVESKNRNDEEVTLVYQLMFSNYFRGKFEAIAKSDLSLIFVDLTRPFWEYTFEAGFLLSTDKPFCVGLASGTEHLRETRLLKCLAESSFVSPIKYSGLKQFITHVLSRYYWLKQPKEQ